ncbi:MAG: DUF420 domain-containing protein [Chthoniobacterales bacterium]
MATSTSSANRIIAAIILVSLGASGFLFWLLYWHKAPAEFSNHLLFLPALNAFLNGLSATSLCVGLFFICKGNWKAHRFAMVTAFVFSSLFLFCYILHHSLHGDTHFAGSGGIRIFYLLLLASHILLSVVALPLILITFFFALSTRFVLHKRLARITFPLWLYVSITGVVVYLMLNHYEHQPEPVETKAPPALSTEAVP